MSINEKKEIYIKSLVQAIPYVGGSLSTLYFGSKQKKRFKRIEDFYTELKDEIGSIKDEIKDIDEHNPDELSAILEELNEKIEVEHLEIKRKYYKQYFFNTLKKPVKNNFDERKLILDILSELSPFQIELIIFIAQETQAIPTNSIRIHGMDESLIVGAINKLKTSGLVQLDLTGISMTNSGGSMHENVKISPFGKRFHEFCIKSQ